MYRLNTNLSNDTKRKIEEIARHLGLSDRHFYRDVIERAVDVLYEKVKQPTQSA